jgi:hypothetical protein
MTYNASAFNVGRRVLIEFEDQEWSGAKIIGFESYPGAGMDYYFIHNFETAVDQPDYVWDMKIPDDYGLYPDDSYITTDSKFGTSAMVLKEYFVIEYWGGYDDITDTDLTPPFTMEYWFKFDGNFDLSGPYGSESKANFELFYMSGVINGWLQIEVSSSNGQLYLIEWGGDMDDNVVADTYYDTVFSITTNLWHHFAVVVTADKIKWYIDGILQNTYTSLSSVGFMPRVQVRSDGRHVMNAWEYVEFWNESLGVNMIVDALSISRSEKYTENFTPPTEPPSV